jgi:lipopolysaccharide assembly outer membrane protein LptD (OstA)
MRLRENPKRRPGWAWLPLLLLVAAPLGAQASKQYQLEHADHALWVDEAGTFTLTGNVSFASEDVKLYCDECSYREPEDTASGTGHVRVVDPEATITGDRLEADFKEGVELARIIGNVKIVAQAKTDEEEADSTSAEYRQKRTTIFTPQIDYYFAEDRKEATLLGPVKAEQEDKTVWADVAHYNGLEDTVRLEDNVRLVMESGTELHTPWVLVHLDTNDFETGPVTGVVVREEDEEEEPTANEAEGSSAEESVPAEEGEADTSGEQPAPPPPPPALEEE